MLEPPSAELVSRLQSAGLCTPSDFRRARSRVRRLTRDLPAFDSVWIDALVQNGRLTPFQGRVLESDHPERLQLGSQVLVEQLARGADAVTYRVTSSKTRRPAVAKWLPMTGMLMEACRERLQELINRTARFSHPHLVVPRGLETVADGLVVLSPDVPGETLADLLVRRGRFPAEVVNHIARQLLAGLGALHARGMVHGEIRLSNIRLGNDGRCVLVDAGIRPAISPQLTIHQTLPLDFCDTLAPELIGSGQSASVESDLYALGCVLWQLLAGRPTSITADPLAKLATHQTHDIPDPRQWAPETPKSLAEGILWLTRRDPRDRPVSTSVLREQWGSANGSGRRLLRRFRVGFDHPVPMLAGPLTVPAPQWPWIAMTVMALAVLVAGLWERGLKTQLLSVTNHVALLVKQPWQLEPGDSSGLKPGQLPDGRFALPSPSADGVITLDHAGPYAPSEITQVGPLAIRARTGIIPVIEITDQPLKVVAQQLTLDGIQLRYQESASATDPPRSLLLVEAQSVHLVNSRFQAGSLDAEETTVTPIAVAWKLFDRKDALGGQLTVKNSLCIGSGAWLYADESPQNVRIDNCLKVGRGPLLTLGHTPQSGTVRLQLRRVTLRETGPLIRIRGPLVERNGGSRLELELEDCILDPVGKNGSLIELFGERLRPDWNKALQIIGDGSLAREQTELVTFKSQKTLDESPLETTNVALDGLIFAPFEFRGPLSPIPADAVLKSFQAPRRSLFPPGIDPDSLR